METAENLVYTTRDGQAAYGKKPSAEELQKLKAEAEQKDFEAAQKALPKKIEDNSRIEYATPMYAPEEMDELEKVRQKIADLPTKEDESEMQEAA